MATPTAEEQYYLELINEARLDPLASAARYINSYAPLISSDPGIQAALNYFGVDRDALQAAFTALTPVGALAWNDALGSAAEKHSAAMIAADDQSHQVAGEADLLTRIKAEQYNGKDSPNGAGENVYAYSESTLYGHAGFMVDWGFDGSETPTTPNFGESGDGMQDDPGHRNNIMRASFREVGIDVTNETNPGVHDVPADLEQAGQSEVGPQVVTQDFAARTGKYFVLGVAYTDSDINRFYTVGEGRGDLTVQAGLNQVTSAASGGYSLEVGTGTRTVTLSGGGLSGSVTASATITTENIKLDVVNGNTLLSSGSLTVTSGAITVLRGLGARGLSLSAGAGSQTVEGTSGNDTLTGGLGNDTVIGGSGTDLAVFSGNRANYLVTQEGQNYRLIDQRAGGGDGNDVATGIEQFLFADGTVLIADILAGNANIAPVANADSTTTAEDTPVTIAVLANDTDGNADALSVAGLGTPAHGVAVLNAGGTVTYTPDANYNGQDSFSYTAADGKGGTASATVTVTVTAVNDLPDAVTDSGLATAYQTPLVTTAAALLANDTDVDGDVLTIVSVQGADHGTVGMASGQVTFTPSAGYSGAASFTYTVSDGKGGTDTASVSLNVAAPVNRAPVADADGPYAATEDTKLTVSAANGVLAGDTDADGDPLTAQLVTATAHGSIVLSFDGSFVYTPDANYNGADSFSYQAKDGSGALSATQTVTIAVATVNDAPDAKDDTAQMVLNTGVKIPVLANDSDVEGGLLSITGAGAAAHGAVVVNGDGTITYTPQAGYKGTDSFTYTIADGQGGSDTATVSLAAPLPMIAQTILTPGQSYGVTGFAGFPTDGFITGTAAGAEVVTVGDFTTAGFSNNFASGGDTIRLAGLASQFEIAVSGNQVLLSSAANQITVNVPVGLNALNVIFETSPNVFDDTRALRFVADGADADTLPDLFLGSQRVFADLAAVPVDSFSVG